VHLLDVAATVAKNQNFPGSPEVDGFDNAFTPHVRLVVPQTVFAPTLTMLAGLGSAVDVEEKICLFVLDSEDCGVAQLQDAPELALDKVVASGRKTQDRYGGKSGAK